MPKILCFTPLPSHPEVTFYTIDDETFESKFKNIVLNKSADLPRKNVKAVIFRFTKGEQKESSKLAKMLEEYYLKYKIPFFCCSWNSIYLSATLMAIVDEYGDKIFDEALDDDMAIIFCEEKSYKYFKLQHQSENYFHITDTNCFPSGNGLEVTLKMFEPFLNVFICCPSAMPEIPATIISMENNKCDFASLWRQFIFSEGGASSETSSPKEVQESIIEVLADDKIITVLNKDIRDYLPKAIVLKALSLLEEQQFKYNVSNNSFKNYVFSNSKAVAKMCSNQYGEKFILRITKSDTVPIKKGIVYYKDMEDILLLGPDGMENSVFLKNIPTAVSFVDGKVQIGNEAIKMKENFNSFVINDLITIMMTNFTDSTIYPGWGFSLIEDNNKNDEILLEFDTFRGRRKSTPAFLFALILKWIIKNVEEAFDGQLPDTLVIVSRELNENLKKQLKNSYENTKLQLNDFQIQHHKFIEIKE
uniref:Uncharacterized protein n=1 Tax=Panagrolaimus sp. ES5 TaxID=591445 RepID=A0AC34FNM4_9BILA